MAIVLNAQQRVLSTIVATAGLLVVALNDPASSGFFPPCIFLKLTGFECPGCGSTRCLHQLLHGNVKEALDLNLLAVIALPWLLWRFGHWLFGKTITRPKLDYKIIAMFGIVIVTFGILRNTGIDSLSFLAATE